MNYTQRLKELQERATQLVNHETAVRRELDATVQQKHEVWGAIAMCQEFMNAQASANAALPLEENPPTEPPAVM